MITTVIISFLFGVYITGIIMAIFVHIRRNKIDKITSKTPEKIKEKWTDSDNIKRSECIDCYREIILLIDYYETEIEILKKIHKYNSKIEEIDLE